MRKIWNRYLELLDQDLNTRIFDNFKNLVLCALLFAAGTDALRRDHHLFMSIAASSLAGWGLITLSAGLLFLNMCDGIRRLSKLRYHLALQILIVLLYVIICERVVDMVWNFRS